MKRKTKNNRKKVDVTFEVEGKLVFDTQENKNTNYVNRKKIEKFSNKKQRQIKKWLEKEKEKGNKTIYNNRKVFDIWGDKIESKCEKQVGKHSMQTLVPAVKLPHPGQSINPSIKHYNELMNTIIDRHIQDKQEYDKIMNICKPIDVQLQNNISEERLNLMNFQQKVELYFDKFENVQDNVVALTERQEVILKRKPLRRLVKEKLKHDFMTAVRKRKENKVFLHKLGQIKKIKKIVDQEIEQSKCNQILKLKQKQDEIEKEKKGDTIIYFKNRKLPQVDEPIYLQKDYEERNSSLRAIKIPDTYDAINEKMKVIRRRGFIGVNMKGIRYQEKSVKNNMIYTEPLVNKALKYI